MEIPDKFYNLKKAGVNHHPRAYTVGELIEILEELPPHTEISSGFNIGCEVVVYNHGQINEMLEFSEIEDE